MFSIMCFNFGSTCETCLFLLQILFQVTSSWSAEFPEIERTEYSKVKDSNLELEQKKWVNWVLNYRMKVLINLIINGKVHQNRFQEIKEGKQKLTNDINNTSDSNALTIIF